MGSQSDSAIDRPLLASSALCASTDSTVGLMPALGGLLGSLASLSCCIAPLVFFTLGISGAWIGNLTALEPYQPVFIVATLAFLGAGYYRVLRQNRIACAGGTTCARPLPRRIVTSALWAATALVVAAIIFPYIAPALLGV